MRLSQKLAILAGAVCAVITIFISLSGKELVGLDGLLFDRALAEHWTHIRTTNPIESTFATVRHRTKRSKGCLSMATMELMVFKVIKEAEKTWLRLRGKNQLPKLITGVKFNDGVEQQNQHNQNAA
jgi:hypothetical protein